MYSLARIVSIMNLVSRYCRNIILLYKDFWHLKLCSNNFRVDLLYQKKSILLHYKITESFSQTSRHLKTDLVTTFRNGWDVICKMNGTVILADWGKKNVYIIETYNSDQNILCVLSQWDHYSKSVKSLTAPHCLQKQEMLLCRWIRRVQ